MKIGTHNLGPNAFASTTIAKMQQGGLTLTQFVPGGGGGKKEITLSAEQAKLLKDVL